MLRGLFRLTWLELKIFLREPLGVIGSVGFPVLVFALMTRLVGKRLRNGPPIPAFMSVDLPVFTAILIVLSAVMSLITIVAIYRESGILKRLRATPLRPYTILLAHVVVKLLLTGATMTAMMLAGRRYFPVDAGITFVSFPLALVFSTLGFLSVGFIIASVVPTARFAQPIGALIFYPMLGLSGLFVPTALLPPPLRAVARASPLTYAVSLLRGVWHGEGWRAHTGDVVVLMVMLVICAAVSARVFRWE